MPDCVWPFPCLVLRVIKCKVLLEKLILLLDRVVEGEAEAGGHRRLVH